MGQLLSREASVAASDFQNHSRSSPPRAVSSHPSPHKRFPSTLGKSRAVINPGSSPSLVELGIIQNMDSSPSPSPGFVWPLITQIFEAWLCKELIVQRDGAEICSVAHKGRWAPSFTLDGGLSISRVGAAPGVLPFGSGMLGLTTPILGAQAGNAPAGKGESGKRCWVTSLGSLPSAPAFALKQGSSCRGTEVGQAPKDTPPSSQHALPRGAEHCENYQVQVKSHP